MNSKYIMNNFDILNINQMFQMFRLTNSKVLFSMIDNGVLNNTVRGSVSFNKEYALFNFNNNEINLFTLKNDDFKVVTNAIKIPREDIDSILITPKSLSYEVKLVLKYGNFKINIYKDYNGFPNQRDTLVSFRNIYKV